MQTNTKTNQYYENIEFNLTTGQTDYNLDSNQTSFLTSFGVGDGFPVGEYASYLQIRTNQTISVRINSVSNHSITIASTDSPFTVQGVQIRNLFLSNSSGSTAAVKIFLTQSPF